jgi:large subunit ribosomal protein L18
MNHTHAQLDRRRARVRSRISGSEKRPRLSVKITLSHVTAQVINDLTGTTLAYISTVGQDVSGNLTEKATWVGTEVAKAAKLKNVSKVAFDRNGRRYHGRLHALAEAARAEGLEF